LGAAPGGADEEHVPEALLVGAVPLGDAGAHLGVGVGDLRLLRARQRGVGARAAGAVADARVTGQGGVDLRVGPWVRGRAGGDDVGDARIRPAGHDLVHPALDIGARPHERGRLVGTDGVEVLQLHRCFLVLAASRKDADHVPLNRATTARPKSFRQVENNFYDARRYAGSLRLSTPPGDEIATIAGRSGARRRRPDHAGTGDVVRPGGPDVRASARTRAW